MKKISRREFLVLGATIGMGIGPLANQAFAKVAGSSNLPKKPIPAQRVVHTHSDQATHWDYQTGWYGDYVDQTVVDRMTERGIMDLTGALTPADAWRVIIPAYAAGQKVAIKINLNNATYDSRGQVIDALPQPINAVIKGLKAIGVPENDIWVYDVTNGWHRGEIPARLMKKVAALYPGVQFHSNDSKFKCEWKSNMVPSLKKIIYGYFQLKLLTIGSGIAIHGNVQGGGDRHVLLRRQKSPQNHRRD